MSEKLIGSIQHEESNLDTAKLFEDMRLSPRTANEIALNNAMDLLRLPTYMIEKIDNINTSVSEEYVTIEISFVGTRVVTDKLYGCDGSVTEFQQKPLIETWLSDNLRDLSSYPDGNISSAKNAIDMITANLGASNFEGATEWTKKLISLRKNFETRDILDLDSYHPDDIQLANRLIGEMETYKKNELYELALIVSRQLVKLQKQEGDN